MSFSDLISKMLVLFSFICIGLICSKTRVIDEEGRKTLNKLVFNVSSPALIISSVLNSEISYSGNDILLLILFATIFCIVTLIVGFVARILFKKQDIRGISNLTISFGNIAFMGFPVISALYGNSAIFLVSICTIPFNIFLFSIGSYLVIGKGNGNGILKKILLNPSLIATAVSICLFIFHFSVPTAVSDIFSYLGNMVVPLSMIIIGTSLGEMAPKSVFSNYNVYLVSFCKLIIMPIVISLLFRLFIKDQLFYGIFTVIAAMPTAAMAPVICTEYGGNVKYASSCVFMTTLISLATVPAMVYLLLL